MLFWMLAVVLVDRHVKLRRSLTATSSVSITTITSIILNFYMVNYRIDRGRYYTAKRDLSDHVTFVKGDFMKMPFPDNTFDRIYSIEATCHAPSLKGVYSEIFRVLKPGGTYATYEWLLADNYDPSNPHHKQISYDIEVGDGIPAMVKKSVAVKAFEDVGFELFHDEDLADKDDEVPWYYPLAGELKYVRSLADFVKVSLMTRPARYLSHGLLGVLGFLRLAPPDAMKTADALGVAADALVAGGREKLFTPMQLYVAKKPE
jgi:sterol 24-C-methyltransferase